MLTTKYSALIGAVGFGCSIIAPACLAAPVTAIFSGNLEMYMPAETLLDNPLQFTLTLNYDDSAVGVTPVWPEEFRYNDMFTGQLTLDGNTVAIESALVVLTNDSSMAGTVSVGMVPSPMLPVGHDFFFVYASLENSMIVDGRQIDGIQLLLTDAEGMALSGSNLPTHFPSVSTLEFAYAHAGAFDPIMNSLSFDGIDGHVVDVSITPTAVPLPAPALLLGTGLLGTMCFRRGRQTDA